ncbi:MAG: ATP-binding protein [Bryobacteraceae bacterium]|nr:ATP-binding protein [Bryobacteraceae bacterium]
MTELPSYYRLECRRLRLLLKRHIAWLRTRWSVEAGDNYQGAAIPDQWADRLLEGGLDPDQEAEFRRLWPENCRIEDVTASIAALRERMPMGALARAFDLTAFDCDLVMLAAAPDFDPSIEILYAYAQDDAARKYPTAQIALALFTDGAAARFAAQRRLEEAAPLRRFELVAVEEGPNAGAAFHARPLKLDDRIREFLAGSDALDPRLVRLTREAPAIALPGAQQSLVEDLHKRMESGACDSLNLTGPADCGKLLVARAVFRRLGRRLIEVDPQRLPSEAGDREATLRIAVREARLASLAYFLKAPEGDPGEKQAAAKFLEWVERVQAPIAVDSAERLASSRGFLVSAVERPGRKFQVQMWSATLGDHAAAVESELADLVEQFDLGPEAIARAAQDARTRSNGAGPVAAAHLWDACRAQSGWRMEDLAQRLAPAHSWDDIVLTPDTEKQLREIGAQVARRAQVYERWGFARDLRRGRGISALFSGPSGVGKTMSAEVLANHLALDLYRIDLAGVVSKYIGETEKNLRRIFDATEQSGAILFFDEADALFGKRTEVKDSHDRYANIEVNYLLQRMEEYRGLAILATNRKSALDRAFLRRLRFLVDFPFPDAAHRREIWFKSFPEDAPRGELDFDFLARLEIAGGNIRNIALNAAFLAAERGGRIEFDDVLHAVHREYSKIDKLVTESEFGRHYGGRR